MQTVAVLEHLRVHQRVRGPFLVLAPLSTLGHWKREFEEWTDMNVVYYHDPQGGAEARALIREYEWKFPGVQGARLAQRNIYKFNVLITSYHVFMSDWEHLRSVRWKYVVVDEAHGALSRWGGAGKAGRRDARRLGGAGERTVTRPSTRCLNTRHARVPTHPLRTPAAAPQRSRTATRSCSAR